MLSTAMSDTRTALITGGASGIGLAVAEALASRGGWKIFLIDRDISTGSAAAAKIRGSTFHQADVTNYTSLAEAFKLAFSSSKRLDFVFGNAGIAMTAPVPADQEGGPPGPPDTSMIDVNLLGAINTSRLALYYLAQNNKRGGDLIITASCAGFYASAVSPAYAASKHGVIGWTRSIAPAALRDHGIRVNAICPGIARTNILPDAVFEMFPPALLTPVSKIVSVVLMILDAEMEGHAGHGQTIEVCGEKHYFREQIEYCDAAMEALVNVGAD